MTVIYQWCRASSEGDPAGFVTAWDYTQELTDLDWEALTPSASVWMVPGTNPP